MAQPNTLPTWATDATFPAGPEPEAGYPTKVAPTLGKQQTGFRPDEIPTAEELNWAIGWLCLWAAYVKAGVVDGNLHVTGNAQFDGDVLFNTPAAAARFKNDVVTFDGEIDCNTLHAAAGIGCGGEIGGTNLIASGNVYQGARTKTFHARRWFNPDTGAQCPVSLTGSYPLEVARAKITAGTRAWLVIDELDSIDHITSIVVNLTSASAAYNANVNIQNFGASIPPGISGPVGNPTTGSLTWSDFTSSLGNSTYVVEVYASGGADIYVYTTNVALTTPHP